MEAAEVAAAQSPRPRHRTLRRAPDWRARERRVRSGRSRGDDSRGHDSRGDDSRGDENRGGMLEAFLERLDHRGGIVAVDEAMIEGRGDIHDAAYGDGALHHYRSLDGAVDADDRHFRGIDDRRAGDPPEFPETRDGDGRAAELLALRLLGARRLAHATGVPPRLAQAD